ncbi:alpha/beta hydrolase [Polymorphospora lycopeni]|uniref:Alpha/beta hydrolase n=1 Tax=Polymorphospora lycopeni TaxID=3140240 RepID=A0ABV5CIT6_9ACTN
MGRGPTRRRLAAHATTVLLGLGLLGPAAQPVRAGPTADPYAAPSPAAAMLAAGGPYAEWAASGRRLLVFDRRGGGRAVEVVGDLAGADRIAVLVPGVSSTLRDFDRGLGGVAHRAPSVQARALYGQLRAADPRVAVVAWLGYDPPDGIGWAAARPDSARDGAVLLAAFARDLAARRPGVAITLVGHSYGALVVGMAAADLPCQVTDLVALGGVGMGADDVSGLGGTARIWAAEAAGDWIRRLPPVRLLGLGHGTRPATPSFGARPLPVDDGAGHDDYLVPGGTTLRALADVVLAARATDAPATNAPVRPAPAVGR